MGPHQSSLAGGRQVVRLVGPPACLSSVFSIACVALPAWGVGSQGNNKHKQCRQGKEKGRKTKMLLGVAWLVPSKRGLPTTLRCHPAAGRPAPLQLPPRPIPVNPEPGSAIRAATQAVAAATMVQEVPVVEPAMCQPSPGAARGPSPPAAAAAPPPSAPFMAGPTGPIQGHQHGTERGSGVC